MRLSIVEQQDVLNFVADNRAALDEFVGPGAEDAHREDGFVEITLVAALFMSFVISLGTLSKAAMNIGDLISKAMGLIKWCRGRGKDEKRKVPEPSLRERLLVILFEAYAGENKAMTAQRLHYFCGGSDADLETALAEMAAQGIIRKTRQGSWKYVRQ